ncbi:centromere protein H (CENP-H)-domain-containing protein [Rhexocercosporidium sp. MPI-PUGE-AT-0058]|nr:centromere protein H (CENP-H)-domain-containing protein [Rhexocercosporidium sp. MPI-PUGE-AT-0058]
MAENRSQEMDDVEMSDAQVPPLMTEDERRILDVYDRLEELQLEIALLKAQGVLSRGESIRYRVLVRVLTCTDEPVEASDEDIATAQQELLKAKSLYFLRGNVIENVLITNPILRAVHASNSATAIEQDLLPLLEKRDQRSFTLTKLATQERSAQDQLIKVQAENIELARKNTELAARMLALADEANIQRKEDIEDSKLRNQLDELEVEIKLSRQKWRIMKETASAAIAGSGVDWISDLKLRGIVMGDEGDE